MKMQARRALNVLLLTFAVFGVYTLQQQSSGSSDVVQKYLKQGLLGLAGIVDRAITMLPD